MEKIGEGKGKGKEQDHGVRHESEKRNSFM